jgi:hypothetical protein
LEKKKKKKKKTQPAWEKILIKATNHKSLPKAGLLMCGLTATMMQGNNHQCSCVAWATGKPVALAFFFFFPLSDFLYRGYIYYPRIT